MIATRNRPVTLAITMGDPRGIGPEVIAKAVARNVSRPDVRLLIVGSRRLLCAESRRCGVDVCPPPVASPAEMDDLPAAVLDLDNFAPDAVEPRAPRADSGRASLDYIETAVRLVMDGEADAVVTGPISKDAIACAGSPYPGHTEMLGALAGGARPVMLMARPELRVALATTHIALRDVPRALTPDGIVHVGVVFDGALRRYFGADAPRIAVCGLNPHAGEHGRFGDEEERIIEPALEALRARCVDVVGPLAADTIFVEALEDAYDGVIALYHDQGLIPVKLGGLGEVVNITLGLPFVRTSVGHGTAFDIAGRGLAQEHSLVQAMDTAAAMVATARGQANG